MKQLIDQLINGNSEQFQEAFLQSLIYLVVAAYVLRWVYNIIVKNR